MDRTHEHRPPLFLPFVVGVSTLLAVGLLNGWYSWQLLGSEYEWVNGNGPWQRAFGFLFGNDPRWLRTASIVLVGGAAALLGAALERWMRHPAASWVTVGLIVLNPLTFAATADTRSLPFALATLAVATVIWAVPARWGPRALLLAAGGAGLACWGWGSFQFSWSGILTALHEPLAPTGPHGDLGPAWTRKLGFLIPEIALLIAGVSSFRERDWTLLAGGALLFLGSALGAEGSSVDPHLAEASTALLRVAALSWMLALVTSRSLEHPLLRWVAAGLLVLYILSGFAAARLGLQGQELSRRESFVLQRSLDEVPPLPSGAKLLVAGAPRGRDGLPGLVEALPWMVPGRPFEQALSLFDPGPDQRLLVLSWQPVTPLLTGHPLAWSLKVRFPALRPKRGGPQLLNPPPDATLACQRADDEPTFEFSMPHGATVKSFSFVALTTRDRGGAPTLLTRELDDSVLKREVEGETTIYRWKPSWRSSEGEERELLWEREEIALRGTEFTWTIETLGEGEVLMAVPRRVVVLP